MIFFIEELLCVLAAGFFAGLETGLVSANQFALYAKKEKGIVYAQAADFLLLKPERLLSTTLIGTNIAVVTAAVLLNSNLRDAGYESLSWLGSIALSVVLLIMSEIIPKSFFRQNADTLSVRLAPVLVVFYYIFYPLAFVLNLVVKLILAVTGQLKTTKQHPTSKQALRLLVRLGGREAGVTLEDQRVIEDIFDFQETLAREVMIQIHRTLACPRSMALAEVARRALAAGVRFVPIYDGRLDNIVGYVDIEEIVSARDLTVEALVRPPVYYPDTKHVPELYREMNENNLSVVFMSNEYGRISGMITPGEIVAEIVGTRPGSIARKREEIVDLGDGRYRVAGLTDLEDFRNETGIALPKGSYDTVGGCLMDRFGRIPETGERYTHGTAVFTITDRDELHVKAVEVVIQPTEHTPR